MKFPVPAAVLRQFLADPRLTGVDRPAIVRIASNPPEYLVAVRGSRLWYRVASNADSRSTYELSLGFEAEDTEPLWGRVRLRFGDAPESQGCSVQAEQVEASQNGVPVMRFVIGVAAQLAGELLLRDIAGVTGHRAGNR